MQVNTTKSPASTEKSFSTAKVAECCELVAAFLLAKLSSEIGDFLQLGVYRDDGLGVAFSTRKEIENCKKKICGIFKSYGLSI